MHCFSFRATSGNSDGKVGNNVLTPGAPIETTAYAVESASSPFKLFHFQRRAPRADDVVIRIHYCGICHTDIHHVYDDWKISKYPLIPGHEITGVVEQVGSSVKHYRVGDRVGVGCMVDSCLNCKFCMSSSEIQQNFSLIKSSRQKGLGTTLS